MPPKTPSLADRLARCLRAERERRGWSQEKAAAAAGMNLRHYQKLETADVAATLTTLEKLAEAFGVDARELLGV